MLCSITSKSIIRQAQSRAAGEFFDCDYPTKHFKFSEMLNTPIPLYLKNLSTQILMRQQVFRNENLTVQVVRYLASSDLEPAADDFAASCQR